MFVWHPKTHTLGLLSTTHKYTVLQKSWYYVIWHLNLHTHVHTHKHKLEHAHWETEISIFFKWEHKKHTASFITTSLWLLTVWSPIHGPESQQPIVTATEDSCLGSCENQQRCCFLQIASSSSSSSSSSSLSPSIFPQVPFTITLSSPSVLLPSSSFQYIPLSFFFHLFL